MHNQLTFCAAEVLGFTYIFKLNMAARRGVARRTTNHELEKKMQWRISSARAVAWGIVSIVAGLGATIARGAPIVDVYDNTTHETTFVWFNPQNNAGPTGIVADDI